MQPADAFFWVSLPESADAAAATTQLASRHNAITFVATFASLRIPSGRFCPTGRAITQSLEAVDGVSADDGAHGRAAPKARNPP